MLMAWRSDFLFDVLDVWEFLFGPSENAPTKVSSSLTSLLERVIEDLELRVFTDGERHRIALMERIIQDFRLGVYTDGEGHRNALMERDRLNNKLAVRRTISMVLEPTMLPQRGSRLESVSGFKGVYTLRGIRGYLVNIKPPKWKGAVWLRTFSTAREAGYARDAVEFYSGQDFEYNNPELEGTFPRLPSHLRLDSVDDLDEITKFVLKQAREAACGAKKDRGERGGSSSLRPTLYERPCKSMNYLWNDSTTEAGEIFQDATSNQNPTLDPGSPRVQDLFNITDELFSFSPENDSNVIDAVEHHKNRRPFRCQHEGCNKTIKNLPAMKMHHKTHYSDGSAASKTCALPILTPSRCPKCKNATSNQNPTLDPGSPRVQDLCNCFTDAQGPIVFHAQGPIIFDAQGPSPLNLFSPENDPNVIEYPELDLLGIDPQYGIQDFDVTFGGEKNSAEERVQEIGYLHMPKLQLRNSSASSFDMFRSLGSSSLGATSTEQHILPGKKRRREPNAKEIEAVSADVKEVDSMCEGPDGSEGPECLKETEEGHDDISMCEGPDGSEGPECLKETKETESEDDGLSGDVGSAKHGDSQAEVTGDSSGYETNSNHAGRKRKSIDDSDDLIAKLIPLIKIQVEDALNSTLLPLVAVLRSREEHEQNHREQILALEKEKLALKRERLRLRNGAVRPDSS